MSGRKTLPLPSFAQAIVPSSRKSIAGTLWKVTASSFGIATAVLTRELDRKYRKFMSPQ